MSQHYLDTHLPDGTPVHIQSGWDRPLQGFYLLVERTGKREGEYIFNNFDLEEPHPASFEPFDKVLENLGIELPTAMRAEILVDAAANAGNKRVFWTTDGQRSAR